MSSWATGTEKDIESVSVLLAGPPGTVTAWYQAFMSDSRFRVVSFANDPDDLQMKLANRPEVVLLDARIFPGPPPLFNLLTGVEGAVYVVLPADVKESLVGEIQAVASVKGAYRGDVNLSQLLGRMYETALTLRTRAPSLVEPFVKGRRPGTMVTGLRIIAVWNQAGGVGKTTIATNLAYEASRRSLRTLLVGLSAPDDLPLIMGLEPEPNISGWQANPTREGLKVLIQQAGDLDVIAGFRNVIDEARAMNIKPTEPQSIPNLAMDAAYSGYATIILDTPPSTTAPAAIMGANALLLVSRPTAAGAQRTMEAYRTVVKRLAGEHRISPANIMVVLNMATGEDYAPDEWHQMMAGALKKAGLGAPPIAVVIPEDPSIRVAQNNGKLAMQVSDTLARGIHKLADALFGTGAEAPEEESRGLKIGGLRFKIKK
jgi:arsenite-transporting ATPase